MPGPERAGRGPLVAPVRARNLIWIGIVGAGWMLAVVYGTPHLRLRYVWSGTHANPFYHRCAYWGLRSFEIRPQDGQCPLFLFVRAGEEA